MGEPKVALELMCQDDNVRAAMRLSGKPCATGSGSTGSSSRCGADRDGCTGRAGCEGCDGYFEARGSVAGASDSGAPSGISDGAPSSVTPCCGARTAYGMLV